MLKFPGQRPDEKILMVIRKHVIVYARIITSFLIVVIFPLIIFYSIWFKYYPIDQNPRLNAMVGLFVCVYVLLALLLTCVAWLNEEFDIFILTNERLIDITQVTILKRTVASTPLNQIQDVTSDVSGIFQTIFNYGNLEIQTAAGNASAFQIDRVPDPAFLAREILNQTRNFSEKSESLGH